MIAAAAKAAATEGAGPPRAQAMGGSASVANSEPSDTYFVTQTTPMKMASAGGTAAFCEFWTSRGRRVEIAWPTELAPLEAAHPARSDATPGAGAPTPQGKLSVKTMLFADVVGYSQITEKQIEHFAPEFLGAVSRAISNGPERPVVTNTWGDALYMVFDEVREAGRFAIRLTEMIAEKPWKKGSLPDNLSVRLALHTGPVLLCVDPVIRQLTFTGSHVSHAARIEPSVAPGRAWASEAFAAYAAIEALDDPNPGFDLDYVGQIEFAKHYGMYPLYELRAVGSGQSKG